MNTAIDYTFLPQTMVPYKNWMGEANVRRFARRSIRLAGLPVDNAASNADLVKLMRVAALLRRMKALER